MGTSSDGRADGAHVNTADDEPPALYADRCAVEDQSDRIGATARTLGVLKEDARRR